jgi:hypothetical protein
MATMRTERRVMLASTLPVRDAHRNRPSGIDAFPHRAQMAMRGRCSLCTAPAGRVDPVRATRLASFDLMFGVVAIVIVGAVPFAGAGEGGARS